MSIDYNADYFTIDRTFRDVCERVNESKPIHFKPEWDVRVIPPFGGAMMRFSVTHNGKHISVYCDFFNALGYYGDPPKPYWEMYPRNYADGSMDVMRFDLDDTEGLVKNIDEELNGIAAGGVQ